MNSQSNTFKLRPWLHSALVVFLFYCTPTLAAPISTPAPVQQNSTAQSVDGMLLIARRGGHGGAHRGGRGGYHGGGGRRGAYHGGNRRARPAQMRHARPATRPAHRPGHRPGYKPGHRPGHRPGYRPGRPGYRHPPSRYYYGGRYYSGGWRWIAAGIIPATAIILYYNGGRPVYACTAEYDGYYYTGTVVRGGDCYIDVDGRRVRVSRYQVMTD